MAIASINRKLGVGLLIVLLIGAIVRFFQLFLTSKNDVLELQSSLGQFPFDAAAPFLPIRAVVDSALSAS